MSNLDQFTINYKIQVNAAIQNLTKLNQATARTNTGLVGIGKHVKQFATGATQALGQLVPKFNGVSHAMRIMNADFAAAAIGVGLLTAAVGVLMKTRGDYNQQRKEGMDLGISSTRLEDYQRKFALKSNGQIGREQTYQNLKRLQENVYGAYTDPIQFNAQAKELKLAGISPGARGQGATKLTDVMEKLARRFQSMTDEQARGVGRVIGLDPDFVKSLRTQGPGVNKVGMTLQEVNDRAQAEKDLDKFNQSLATVEEKFTELAHILAIDLLPGLQKFVKLIEGVVGSPSQIAAREEEQKKQNWIAQRRDEIASDYYKGRSFGQNLWDTLSTNKRDKDAKFLAQAENEWNMDHVKDAKAPDAQSDQDKKDKVVNALDESNASALQVASDMQLAVNMFAQSVATFANAIDEKTAWSAWAGELGKAAGLKGPGAADSPYQGGSPSTAGITGVFDSMFAAAGKRYGVDPAVLKNIARVESSMNPNEDSGVAGGLMGIKYTNYKAYGIQDPYDPLQSINAGAKIFSEYLAKAGGDVNKALLMYHGGLDQKGWGPKTMAYPGKVLGGSNVGITRPDAMKLAVQRNVANELGMPVEQLQRGGATRGDMKFTLEQFDRRLQNNEFTLNKQLAQVGIRDVDRAKWMTELRDTRRGLDILRSYKPDLMAQTKNSDEREYTRGAREVVINLNGGTYDEKVLADIITGHMDRHFGDLSNSNATAVKR